MQRTRRIVSLISSGTEMLFALGMGEHIVAVSHECDFPAAARTRPRATRSHVDSTAASSAIDGQVKELVNSGAALYGLQADLIRELQPDLIVTQAQCDVCAVRYADVVDLVRSEPELQGTKLLALNPASLEDVLLDIARLGEATGETAAAARLEASLRSRITAVSHRTRDLPAAARPSVVCIEWTSPLMAAGNWTPELIELAGGRSLLAAAGEHSRYCEWDEVRALDPAVLLIAPCGFGLERSLQEAEPLAQLPGWQQLAAVRCRRVHVIDGNAYLNRSGPRLVESLEILAHLLHPQLFGPPELFNAWCSFPL